MTPFKKTIIMFYAKTLLKNNVASDMTICFRQCVGSEVDKRLQKQPLKTGIFHFKTPSEESSVIPDKCKAIHIKATSTVQR